ncbi:MAG: bacteriohemerythrin [Halanaerobiales bacterium]
MIWKDSYKIGIEVVDNQHRELFERLNNFLQVVRNNENLENKIDEIEKTLNFMGKYVIVHFDSEEKVQQKFNYPNYPEHHRIHEEFKQEIQEFKKQFENNKTDEDLIMEFSGRLLTWLINHVTGEDQNIAEYVENGVDK